MQSASELANDEEPALESLVRISLSRRRPRTLFALGDAEDPPRKLAGRSYQPRTIRSALRLATSAHHEVRCVVVSPEFARGSGLKFVSQLRCLRPLLPVLLQLPHPDRNLLSLAYFQGVEISIGYDKNDSVHRFVERALARPRSTLDQLDERLASLAEVHGLTPTERRVAMAAVRGMSRSELLSTFDVSINTLKSQTRSILKKTGHQSLNDLCRVVLMSVVSDAV